MNSNELKIVAYDKDTDIHIIKAVTSYIDSHISCENFSLISGTNKQYINIPLSFDTENSSFRDEFNNKAVISYLWQFGIFDTVIYGRELSEFKKTIDIFKKVLNSKIHALNIKSKKHLIRCAIFVHNLSYDFHYIHKYLEIQNNSVIAYDKRDIFFFNLTRYDDVIIEFRCSYTLTQLPLKKLLKTGDIVKQEAIDYSLIRSPVTRLTDNEIKYSVYDCFVLNEYFYQKFISGETLDKIPLTLTGYARNHLKDICGYRFKKKSDLSEIQKEYQKIVDNCKISDKETLNIYRNCFWGGFTHCGFIAEGSIESDVSHLDFTSSYPTVLISEKYPIETFTRDKYQINLMNRLLTDEELTEINKMITGLSIEQLRSMNIGYIIHFKAHNLNLKSNKYEIPISLNKVMNRTIPENRCYIHSVFNGRVKAGDNIELWCTDIDYNIIKEYYDFNVEILEIRCAKFDYLPESFCNIVLELYSDKTTLKGVKGKEKEYSIKKVILNSLYGLNVTDPIVTDYIYNDELFTVESVINTDESVLKQLQKYNLHNGKINSYMWGVFCTAYARKNLFSGISECGKDYLYSDTDSIFLINYHKHSEYFSTYNKNIIQKIKDNHNVKSDKYKLIAPKDIKGITRPLGIWDKETDCKFFVTVGAKRYLQVYESESGKYDFFYTFAGIKAAFLKNFFLKLFKKLANRDYNYNSESDCKIILKLFSEISNETQYTIYKKSSGKNTSTYIDNEMTGTVIDYQGNSYHYHTLSGVHLEPQKFVISKFTDFDTCFEAGFKLIKTAYEKNY